MVALACPDAVVVTDDAWRLAAEMGRLLDAPYLELRVQEGDHWDFTLYHRTQVVADFSTKVSYFDSNPAAPRPWKLGDAAAFSNLWNVPLPRVLPYLIDWELLTAPRFVAEGDRFPAGDWRQIVDFMRVIGVEDPLDNPGHFQFEVPAWESTHSRQPLWRRVVRRISVWIKGTYPDVPRYTRDEREQWGRSRSRIRVVRVDPDDLVGHD
jgi:hypothetical protein